MKGTCQQRVRGAKCGLKPIAFAASGQGSEEPGRPMAGAPWRMGKRSAPGQTTQRCSICRSAQAMSKPLLSVGAVERLISIAMQGWPPRSNRRSISAPAWVR